MSMHSFVSHILRLATATGLTLCFAHSGFAQDSIAKETLSVTIFSDQYVSAGHVFSDLEALEAWVRLMRPRAIRLDACEPAAARRLLVAAHRFRHVYLEMRQLAAGQSVCALEAAARAVRVGSISPTIAADEDEAVDRYWRALMP
jgi:sulfur relay (sulfurtransferase) complex TusBCD TusD component (DsrE family)